MLPSNVCLRPTVRVDFGHNCLPPSCDVSVIPTTLTTHYIVLLRSNNQPVRMTAVETAVAWATLTTTVVVQRAIGSDSKQQWIRRQYAQYFELNN